VGYVTVVTGRTKKVSGKEDVRLFISLIIGEKTKNKMNVPFTDRE
jgi:hypothetical protein